MSTILSESIARAGFELGVVCTKRAIWEQLLAQQPRTVREVMELLKALQVIYPGAVLLSPTEAGEASSEKGNS